MAQEISGLGHEADINQALLQNLYEPEMRGQDLAQLEQQNLDM
jgi:hypothetical protein